eukprot:CAMPEP_0183301108 /NCGR_PEP_ID=MMETSP0160_2-20130417/7319_1 /TAXON_ID=2839 ORGANISM="Odontella Sinensis, Strain Grunow 1884" /NCGR_SAMPLE_ID=MMETSP0160_2 /ASSEMBLY_ACC=CAM_ASM_000250 /LENGTH=58 /DNA_ID=CAMNT_0025463647 /DNA_START=158 /DNA_END=334 /DNA_ORIENTATION=-
MVATMYLLGNVPQASLTNSASCGGSVDPTTSSASIAAGWSSSASHASVAVGIGTSLEL